MYVVPVKLGRKIVHTEHFTFGRWMDIGYMLDDYGYNGTACTVTIKFEERA
jgi:hypothetical protein